MPITIAFSCKAKLKERSRSAYNLCSLLAELRASQLILLDCLGVEFEFRRGPPKPVRLPTRDRTEVLMIEWFGQFTYQRKRKPSLHQRRAQVELQKGTISLLDSYFRFTQQAEWKRAARIDRRAANTLMRKLCEAQRSHEIAPAALEWEARGPARQGSVLARLTHFVAGTLGSSRKLLIDLLLVRDYLHRAGTSPADVDQRMREAFPMTYPLALQFEALLEREAAQAAIRRHPEKASDPALATRLAFGEVCIQCPDVPIDMPRPP